MNWTTAKLGDVCEIINGSTPQRSRKDFWENGNVSWFTINDLREQGRDIKYTKQKITKLALEKSSIKMLPKDTVLLCCTASIGANAIARIETTTNQQFNGLIPDKKKIIPEFLYYITKTLTNKLLNISGSATINFIAVSKLKQIEISFPSLSEQQRIVTKLDAVFTEIDNAISVEEEKKNQISVALKSIYRDFLHNRQPLMNNKMSFLGDISKVVGGNGFPKRHQGYSNKEIPFIKVSDMNTQGNEKFIFKTAHTVDANLLKTIKAKAHEAGTLIFPKIGGAISTNKKRLLNKISAYDNNIVGIKPSEKLLPEYLHKIFKIIDIYELSNKAALPSINNSAIESIELFVPNLQEQSKIISKLNLVDEHLANLSDCVLSKIFNLKLLKSTMIQHNLSPQSV